MAEGTSSFWGSKRWTDWGASDALNIDSDNDTIEYGWPYPVYVTGAAVIPTTAVADATASVQVEIYRNSGYGDAGTTTLLGTWVVCTTDGLATGTISKAVFQGADTDGETAEDSTTRYVAPTGPYFIDCGDGLTFKVVEAADSGVVHLAVEYIPLPHSNSSDVARTYNVPA